MRRWLCAVAVAAAVGGYAGGASAADIPGHKGFFLGGGYVQQFLASPDHQLSATGAATPLLAFGPGFGASFKLGYDFPNTRWGIQVPIEWANFRFNQVERVNLIGGAAEAVVRLFGSPQWDFHLLAGVGLHYITAGSFSLSSGAGISVGAGPGLSWYVHRGDRANVALDFEIPVRAMFFPLERLSAKTTTIVSVPVRLGVSVGF